MNVTDSRLDGQDSGDVELSDEQQDAVFALAQGVWRGKSVQTLGGYAGTGKTTSIRALKECHENLAVCAYTGKAANVLRRKGIEACTIHSLIYVPERDENGKLRFHLRDSLDPEIEGFIVDEASMVSETIYRHLLTFGLPIVFVGDHGQLPPVEGKFNVMENPDYRLETIHRHAGEIPRFAESLRLGKPAADFKPSSGAVTMMPARKVSDEVLTSVDQVICAFNRTRVELNQRIRWAHDRIAILEIDDRLICLRNDSAEGLFNGLQGHTPHFELVKGQLVIDFVADGQLFPDLLIEPTQLGREKKLEDDNGKHLFDYAYCVTCHKAQGDEWDDVLVFEQRCELWEHARWAYTAASRARRKLLWVGATR
jgi:exodeoxyribonuclease-5